MSSEPRSGQTSVSAPKVKNIYSQLDVARIRRSEALALKSAANDDARLSDLQAARHKARFPSLESPSAHLDQPAKKPRLNRLPRPGVAGGLFIILVLCALVFAVM